MAKAAETASTFERHYVTFFFELFFFSLSVYINLGLMGCFLTKVRVRCFLFRCILTPERSVPSLASPATVTKLSRSEELSRKLSRAASEAGAGG